VLPMMKCSVIAPVGPDDEDLFAERAASVERVIAFHSTVDLLHGVAESSRGGVRLTAKRFAAMDAYLAKRLNEVRAY